MKNIVTYTLLFLILSFSNPALGKKPSWSEDMPERKDTPKRNLNLTDDSDTDSTDFKFDRSSMFNDDHEESNITPENTTNKINLAKADANRKREIERQKIIEAKEAQEKLVLEQKRLEKIELDDKKAKQKLIALEQQKQVNKKNEQVKRTLQQKTYNEKTEQDRIIQAQEEIVKPKVRPPVESTDEIRHYTWKKIEHTTPEYPSKAIREKKEGWVDIEITIDLDGYIFDTVAIKTKNNSKIFNRAALKAVKRWKYEAPSNFGIKENQTKTVRIAFKL